MQLLYFPFWRVRRFSHIFPDFPSNSLFLYISFIYVTYTNNSYVSCHSTNQCCITAYPDWQHMIWQCLSSTVPFVCRQCFGLTATFLFVGHADIPLLSFHMLFPPYQLVAQANPYHTSWKHTKKNPNYTAVEHTKQRLPSILSYGTAYCVWDQNGSCVWKCYPMYGWWTHLGNCHPSGVVVVLQCIVNLCGENIHILSWAVDSYNAWCNTRNL